MRLFLKKGRVGPTHNANCRNASVVPDSKYGRDNNNPQRKCSEQITVFPLEYRDTYWSWPMLCFRYRIQLTIFEKYFIVLYRFIGLLTASFSGEVNEWTYINTCQHIRLHGDIIHRNVCFYSVYKAHTFPPISWLRNLNRQPSNISASLLLIGVRITEMLQLIILPPFRSDPG